MRTGVTELRVLGTKEQLLDSIRERAEFVAVRHHDLLEGGEVSVPPPWVQRGSHSSF